MPLLFSENVKQLPFLDKTKIGFITISPLAQYSYIERAILQLESMLGSPDCSKNDKITATQKLSHIETILKKYISSQEKEGKDSYLNLHLFRKQQIAKLYYILGNKQKAIQTLMKAIDTIITHHNSSTVDSPSNRII